MIFCSISSGSKGNSYIVKTEETNILIDVGISGKQIKKGLEALAIHPDRLDAVLITHEHSDHVKGLKIACKNHKNAKVLMNRGTLFNLKEKYMPNEERIEIFNSQESFHVGDIKVTPFPVHHDAAEPVGFILENGIKKIAFVTDTGYICDEIYERIKTADILVLEANHDEEIVKVCSYPYDIKMRILGDYGHISNTSSALVLRRILASDKSKKYRQVLLAHMSQENNTKEIAKLTFESLLREKSLLDPERLKIDILEQSKISLIYKI